MIKPHLSFGNFLDLVYGNQEKIGERGIKDFTFQVTDDCNLCCSYCYQINKKHNKMTFDTAKKYIDNLFINKYNPNAFYNKENTRGFIINFIGGEPLLEIDLMDQIIEYFELKFLEDNDEEWLLNHTYNISTNGTLYFTPKVQNFIKKYRELLSIGVTVDGNKQLHDSCRLFPNGQGSYDIAIKAALEEKKYGSESTKITLSPENIENIVPGVQNMISLGFKYIHMNCVFEDVWNKSTANILFQELIKLANWINENNLYDKIYISILYPESYVQNRIEQLDKNWCGASLGMSAIDYKGDLYPCIRFMESSLGEQQKPLKIGNINQGGYLTNQEQINNYQNLTMNCITKKLCPLNCLQCPISSGCAWCIGLGYQYTGNFNQRLLTTCDTHKMQALATKYLCKICKDKESYDLINLDYSMYNQLISQIEFDRINTWKEEN